MTKHGEGRKLIALRIAATGLEWVDALAAKSSTNRSEMIRRMLAYAITHMPGGWKP